MREDDAVKEVLLSGGTDDGQVCVDGGRARQRNEVDGEGLGGEATAELAGGG